MLESKEVLNNVVSNRKKLEEKEIVSKVLSKMKLMEETPIDNWEMHTLANHIFTLCTYMDNLSELKEYAYIKAETLEEEYKATVREEYLAIKKSEEKMTDGMAKTQAEQRCDAIKQKELEAVYQARRLRDLYENCSRLINFTQSKMKTYDDSRVRSNMPQS